MRVSDPRLHKQYGREVRNFDPAVWERERYIKYCACRLLRQVRPKPYHVITSLGHGRQASRGT